VFINLINNAIDAAEKNQPSWVRVSMLDQGDTIRVRVTDSGQGLTKALQERLFQPFFTTKSVGEGTGLGLSIAKGIVEGHGGTLNIVSDSPNTCFEVILIKQK
jgi:signal transduction histidine kinase